MPRPKLIYTHLFPYHVRARCNNQEWFYINKPLLWSVFKTRLRHIDSEFGFKNHAFVLMDNHYHLLGSASEAHHLGKTMCWLQTSVSRAVGRLSGRTNHVFGGPYRASLVTTPQYYHNVLKYIYQNPLRAHICDDAHQYPFSTLGRNGPEDIVCTPPDFGIDSLVPQNRDEIITWANDIGDPHVAKMIQLGLRRATFELSDRKTRRNCTDLRF